MLAWGVAIAILSLGAIQWFKFGRKKNTNERLFLIGIASLFMAISIAIIFWVLSFLLIPGYYLNYSYYIYSFDDWEVLGKFLYNIGSLVAFLGFSIYILTFELIKKDLKHYLTYTSIILSVLPIFLPPDIGMIVVSYITMPFSLVMFIIISPNQYQTT